MKYKITTLFLLFTIIVINYSFAQINLNKAKEKIKNKSEDIIKSDNGGENTENSENNDDSQQDANNDLEELVPKPYTSYEGIIPPPTRKDKYKRDIGQILFSKEPIKYGEENKSAITNQFSSGDEVFGMAYLADNKINMNFEQGYKIWIHDAENGSGYNCVYDFERFEYEPNKDGTNNGEQKYYDLDIFATNENAWDKYLAKHILEYLAMYIKNAKLNNYVAKRMHRFEVQLLAGGYLVAKGEFYYDLTENSEKVLQMYEEYQTLALKEFYLPASKRNDPALAEKIKQVMIGHGVNVQKVIFSTDDWGIIRHEISGAVLSRTIWAYIVYKNEKGVCYYDEVQFGEEFVGNAFNGVVKKLGYGTANGQILCENVK